MYFIQLDRDSEIDIATVDKGVINFTEDATDAEKKSLRSYFRKNRQVMTGFYDNGEYVTGMVDITPESKDYMELSCDGLEHETGHYPRQR